MIFSTATLRDIPLIQDLAEKTWWPTYGPIQPREKIEYLLKTFYSSEALTRAISEDEQEFVLVHDEGSPMGFAAFGRNFTKQDSFKIHKLYVLPTTHGKGYGRALVEEVKRRVSTRVVEGTPYHIELNVYRGNPARAFYERIGFRIIGEVNEPVGKFYFEDYVMRLDVKQ